MPSYYGYCCLTQWAPLSIREQFLLIQGHAERHSWPFQGVVLEQPEFAQLPWLERPVGRALLHQLQPGDHVLVARPEVVFTTAKQLLEALKRFEDHGIKVHFVELLGGMPANGLPMEPLFMDAMRMLAHLNHQFRSRQVRQTVQTVRSKGRRYTRDPGYGYKWAGPRGRQTRVPDLEERQAMQEIERLRHEGMSWNAIAAKLLWQGVKTKDGQEWSPDRVRRAYRAQVRVFSTSR